VFVEERLLSDGSLVGTATAMPTAAAGTQGAFTLSGTSTSEGGLSRSVDTHYVTLLGYAVVPGTTGVTSSTSSAVNRVVGRVDATGATDTSTLLNDSYSGSNPRSACSTDGTVFWLGGNSTSNGGVRYATLGATTSTQIAATPANTRVVQIFNSQLYMSSASGANVGVNVVGTGLPTTTGQTSTLIVPTSTTATAYSFAIFDRDVVPGFDTMYVAIDALPGADRINIQKWYFNGTVWSQDTTFMPTLLGSNVGTRGLAAWDENGSIRVVATTNEASANRIVTFLDDGPSNPTVTVLSTAAGNTIYRGIARSPL
jgi:hypothetical protein